MDADLPEAPEPEAIPDPLELLRGQLNENPAPTVEGDVSGEEAASTAQDDASSLILEGGATEPAPATTEPAPATTEPAPATTEPAPATTEPAPATTEPPAEPTGDDG